MPLERAHPLEVLVADVFADLDMAPRPAAAVWGPLPTRPYPLDPTLATHATTMATRRLIGFSAGREAARRAQNLLGGRAQPVAVGRGGAPVWPEGLIGSITHTDSLVCALVMTEPIDRSMAPGPKISVGIDAEQLGRIDREVASSIMSSREAQAWQGLGSEAANHGATATFCLKEALYKAQYPMTERWLGFEHIEVQPSRSTRPDSGDNESCSYTATLNETASSPLDPIVRRPLLGRCRVLEDHVLSVVILQQQTQSA